MLRSLKHRRVDSACSTGAARHGGRHLGKVTGDRHLGKVTGDRHLGETVAPAVRRLVRLARVTDMAAAILRSHCVSASHNRLPDVAVNSPIG